MSITDFPKDPQEMPVKPKLFGFHLHGHTLVVIGGSLYVIPIPR